jgi:hypothetical protein
VKKLLLTLIIAPGIVFASPVLDKIYAPGKNALETKINNAVREQFGWEKKLVEKRISEGTYTETQIKTYHNEKAETIVKADVQEKHDKIKPVKIDVKRIKALEIEYIRYTLAELTSLKVPAAGFGTAVPAPGNVALADTQIESIILRIIDLSVPAKQNSFDEVKLRAMLSRNDYKGVENLLSEIDVSADIKDAVIGGIMPKREPFFIDAVFEQNAYLVEKNWNRDVLPGDVVIVNVSDILDRLKFAEFISRNKGKRYAVQLGLGAMNNKDNPAGEWPEIARQFKEFYILAKSCDPGLCVGITVCAAPNWREWRKSFAFEPDVVFLWNIYKQGFSVRAVKKQFGENIVIAGMNAMGESKEQSSPGELIKKVKEAGFQGVIWYNRHP